MVEIPLIALNPIALIVVFILFSSSFTLDCCCCSFPIGQKALSGGFAVAVTLWPRLLIWPHLNG